MPVVTIGPQLGLGPTVGGCRVGEVDRPDTKLELHKKEPKKLELQKKEPSKLELQKKEPTQKRTL